MKKTSKTRGKRIPRQMQMHQTSKKRYSTIIDTSCFKQETCNHKKSSQHPVILRQLLYRTVRMLFPTYWSLNRQKICQKLHCIKCFWFGQFYYQLIKRRRRKGEKSALLLNHCLLLGRFYIYSCQCKNVLPSSREYVNQVNQMQFKSRKTCFNHYGKTHSYRGTFFLFFFCSRSIVSVSCFIILLSLLVL